MNEDNNMKNNNSDSTCNADFPGLPEFCVESVLAHKLVAANHSASAIAAFRADHDSLEEAIDESPVVLTLSWDSDSPAGAGGLCVHRWSGLYFMVSDDWGIEGPVESLDPILGDERLCTPCESPELSSDEIDASRLLSIARRLTEKAGDRVTVNGRRMHRGEHGDLVESTTAR